MSCCNGYLINAHVGSSCESGERQMCSLAKWEALVSAWSLSSSISISNATYLLNLEKFNLLCQEKNDPDNKQTKNQTKKFSADIKSE